MFGFISIVFLLDNADKKVSGPTIDTADGTLNVESKANILKKLSKF